MLTCYRTFDNWKQAKVSIIHVPCSHSAPSSHPAIEAEREWGLSGLFLWHFPGHCLAPSLCGGGGCSPAPSLYAQHTSSQVVNGGFNPVGRDSLRSIRNSLAKCTRCQRPDHQVSRGWLWKGVWGGGWGTKYAWAIAHTPSDSPVAPFVVPQLGSWLSAAFVVVI